MKYGEKIFDNYLNELYKTSINLKDYNDEEKNRIGRFILNLNNYYADMISNNYINEDTYNYYLAKFMCLNYVEINGSELEKNNSMSCFTSDYNGGKIVTTNFNKDYIDTSHGIYIDSKTFEKLIDYHELTHVLMNGLSCRALECARRVSFEENMSIEEYKKLKETISDALLAMNEYTAEYISNDLVVSMYKEREQLYVGSEHFMGFPYKSHLINYHMLEPIADASANLLFKKENSKDIKRRLFAQMMLKFDPTKEIEGMINKQEELAIYDAFKSSIDVLYNPGNKVKQSVSEYKSLKRLKRMK